MNVLLIGAPGSGKSTQGDRLSQRLGLEHIAAGDRLRAEATAGTPLGKEIATYLDRGELVPDQLVIDLILPAVLAAAQGNGYILEGFPRSVGQATRALAGQAGAGPDVVMASCGDVPTMESLAATALLRQHLPDVKVRFVNVVDLFKLVPHTEHPHGMTDREFEALFTATQPVVFNFHSYPWLIHRLTYRRPGQHHIHVRGYKEKGNINTPLELAIRNQTDRFSLAIDAIDRIPRFLDVASGFREALLNEQIECKNHAYEFGIDRADITDWKWPF